MRSSKVVSTSRLALVISLLGVLQPVETTYAQWEVQKSNTTASLRGIHSVGNGVAWASGTLGTILRTIDGGATWQTCTTPPDAYKLDFRGIQGFDEKTAIGMSSGKGGLSRLYKTTDACKTWRLVFANPDKEGFWDAIQFYQGPILNQGLNHSSGMLIGDPVNGAFAIFSTHDSGDTWHRWGGDPSTRQAKAYVGEALFAASNSSIVSPGINGQYCFVTGGKGGSRLLFEQGHSPFGASSWSAFSSVPLPFLSGESAGAFSIARREDGKATSRFVAVGGDYLKPANGAAASIHQPVFLFKASVKHARTPPRGYRSSVAYEPTTRTWITVGPNGTDISTNDGRDWHPLTPTAFDPADEDKRWNALSLPFVVGPEGRIGKLRSGVLKAKTKR